VPIADELIMGLVAMTLASLRKKPVKEDVAKSPPGDIEGDKVEGE
jgi:hypothetical protein